jgi:hypothetical protein
MGTSLVRVVMLMIKEEEASEDVSVEKVLEMGFGGPLALSPHALCEWQP